MDTIKTPVDLEVIPEGFHWFINPFGVACIGNVTVRREGKNQGKKLVYFSGEPDGRDTGRLVHWQHWQRFS